MINLDRNFYPYLEEVNEGVERQFQPLPPGQTKRILDIGCGQGQLGEAIQKKAYEVWGIEANQHAVDAAARRLHRAIQSDLHDHDRVRDELDGAIFDSLIFSDVLEHTYDPLKVLRAYLNYVRPGGSVVISVPNALVWEFRFKYLFGKFDYQDTGVLDRTHIRFFTFKNARKLVEAAGCKITIVDSTPYIVRAILPADQARGLQTERCSRIDDGSPGESQDHHRLEELPFLPEMGLSHRIQGGVSLERHVCLPDHHRGYQGRLVRGI